MVSNLRTNDFTELVVFVAVADKRGITAAADALGMPKSVISKRLAQLELRLGVKLVERSSRRVALTREGIRLLPRVQSIIADTERLYAQAAEEAAEPAGLVRMAASPEFGALLAARFVPKLLQQHPALQVAMRLDYQAEDLFDPALDFAFRIGTIQDDRLVARPLGSFRRILVASAEFVSRHRIAQPVDLGAVECLTFSDHALDAQWTLQAMSSAQEADSAPQNIQVRGRMAAQSFNALLHAAEQGLGVARVPDFAAAPVLARGTLVRVLPGWASLPSNVWLVYRFGADRVGRVRAALDCAETVVAEVLRQAARVVFHQECNTTLG